MKRWLAIVSVAALILFVSVGCSSKKDDDAPVVTGGVLNLKSSASPQGATRENQELDSGFEIRLTVNRAGAKIYYTASSGPGNVPGDPGFTSSIYNSATPFTLDTSYYNSTFIVKYFAWYQDPTTHNMEQEYPFNTSQYTFRPDIHPPTVIISPDGGTFADVSEANPITITATDNIDTPDQITVYYTYTEDGTEPADPKTASMGSGPGDGTVTLTWTGGHLWVKAYAKDTAGNESSVASEQYSIDASQGPRWVWQQINTARDNAATPLDALKWMPSWANACEEHCALVFVGDQGGTLVKPDGSVVSWYDDATTEKKQLMDFDADPATGFVISASAMAMGMENCTSPSQFLAAIQSIPALWDDILMSPDCKEFGCGFYEDFWEMMCTIVP